MPSLGAKLARKVKTTKKKKKRREKVAKVTRKDGTHTGKAKTKVAPAGFQGSQPWSLGWSAKVNKGKDKKKTRFAVCATHVAGKVT